MTQDRREWDESSSESYKRLASVIVPQRAEQMASLLTLLPFKSDEAFRVVELASGEGYLAQALLTAFPKATLLALDLSEEMRAIAQQRLAPFGDRAQVAAFDMAAHDWYGQLDKSDAVLSSLCIHHLDAGGKQALFAAVGERLSRRGAFLIADIVEPARPQARELFAAVWDRIVEAQAGGSGLYEEFQRSQWNYYRYPDAMDRPSSLFDQLTWLSKAGFEGVDCFRLNGGHAVFGGYKSPDSAEGGISYEQALQIATDVLHD